MGRKTTGPKHHYRTSGEKRTAGLPNQIMKTINKYNFVLGIFSTILIVLLFLPSYAQENTNNYDSLIVKPKESFLRARRMEHLMFRHGISRFRKVRDNIYVIPLNEVNNEEIKLAKINELKESGLFDLVEPDYKFSLDQIDSQKHYTAITKIPKEENLNLPTSKNIGSAEPTEVTPNDKDFASQYYLREINATKAWGITVGEPLLVGILDTGVNANHPDLEGKVIGGESENNLDLIDDIGHGTEVAGIIAANTNNNQGIAGISWNTRILSIRITDEVGQARVSSVVSALDEAYKKGVKIVQISLSTNQFSQTLKSTIKEAQNRGLLIISTAGNTGIDELRFPAAFDNVIGVGAVSKTKERESYSTIGEHVSLVAPGSLIYTTTSANSAYKEVSGTSFSAPQVAGAAALVWSIAPNLTSDQVRNVLIKSADDLGNPGKDLEYGYGILNIERAVELAKSISIQE